MCPYTKRDILPQESCQEPNFYCCLADDGSMPSQISVIKPANALTKTSTPPPSSLWLVQPSMYHFHTSDQRKQQGNISHIPSSPGHYIDIALSTGHYNDIARESCSFELFDLLSDIQTEVELHSLYRCVNSISIVGFSFKV